MSQTFAQVVERVKQLSFAEKQELQELLKKYLIEERRREILENYKAGMEEMRTGELTSFSDADTLLGSLSHDLIHDVQSSQQNVDEARFS